MCQFGLFKSSVLPMAVDLTQRSKPPFVSPKLQNFENSDKDEVLIFHYDIAYPCFAIQ